MNEGAWNVQEWLANAARERATRVHARAHAHANAHAKPQPTDYDEVVIDNLVWLHRQVLPSRHRSRGKDPA